MVAGPMGHGFPHCLFPGRSQDRVAHWRRCRFEVRRLAVIHQRLLVSAGDRIMADLDLSLFSRRPVMGSLIAAGATEQTRNLGHHGRPNTVVRSARARREKAAAENRCFGYSEVVGVSHRAVASSYAVTGPALPRRGLCLLGGGQCIAPLPSNHRDSFRTSTGVDDVEVD